jgi:hypothetical protein
MLRERFSSCCINDQNPRNPVFCLLSWHSRCDVPRLSKQK